MLIGLFIDIQFLNLAHSYYPESTCKRCLHVGIQKQENLPMQVISVDGIPLGPNIRILAQSTVTRAGNIT